ncbi:MULTISPECIES: acyltransferase family protein [Deinococcus]|uniref:Acyltransferase family protein n=1 Tax=Deinococcus rufus TaxID=2136097 RepID=A0ABV7Z3J1_9DEIO|nr:acyltransferase family protein [Deinococcus sp. AB2017081]WQE94763.1 acyltransferase family protein [Deinococcus sp. AB2017081]
MIRPSAASMMSPPHPSRRRQRVSRTPALLLAPFFVVLLAFGLFPLLFSFAISFFDWNPLATVSRARFDGLWTYQNIFTDPAYWPALMRTLGTALKSALMQHAAALPLAFALHLTFRRLQGVLGTVLFLPYVTSPLATGPVLALLFTILWRPLGDLYSALYSGIQAVPALGALASALPYSLDAAGAERAFNLAWNGVGWNILLYLMALNAIPRQLYEAAQVDGAGLFRQFRRITLPLIRPMMFVAFTLSFLAATQASTWNPSAPISYATMTIPEYVIRTSFWDFDGGLAAGQTWVYFAGIAVVVGILYALIGRHFTELDTAGDASGTESATHIAPAPAAALKLLIGLALLSAVLPAAGLLLNATHPYPEFLLNIGDGLKDNYAALLAELPSFWRNVWNSVYVSTLAATGAVLTSLLAGYAFAHLDFPHKRTLYAVVLGVMLFPALANLIPTVLTMGLLGWVEQPRALWVPALASAIGIFLTRQYLQAAVPRSVLEAARIDGARTPAILTRIVVPVAWPVMVTVFLLTFITQWQTSLNALAILHDPDHRLVSQALSLVTGGALSLGAAIATLPTLLLFALAATQLARGLNITTGGGPAAAPVDTVPAGGTLAGADAVRAAACLMVIFHHLSQRLNGNDQSGVIREIQSFVMSGAVGVSAFFVLSGLLLSLPFWRRYLAGRNRPSLPEYARRRFLRIAPGFWASLGVSLLLTVALVPDAVSPYLRALSAATFTSSLHWLTLFPADLNGPLWSIGFEVVCYALLPIGMIGLFAIRRRHPALAFAWWLGIFAVTLLVHQWILTHLVPDAEGRGWQYGVTGGSKYWVPNYNPVGLYGHYLLGVLAAGVIAWRTRSGRVTARWNDALAVLLIAGIAGLLYATRHAPEFSFSVGRQPYFFPTFPLLVAALLATLPFTRFLGEWLDRPLRTTARLSFGLYIWHYLILELIRVLHNPRFAYFGIDDLGTWALTSAAALALAYWAASLSYRHIEEPFLRGMHRKQEVRTVSARPEAAD